MIPNELKVLNRWVCTERTHKIPMQAKRYAPASSIDPTTWADFDSALNGCKNFLYSNVGFVFSADDDIVGIDIDKGFDENGCISSLAEDIINLCHSYTEFSRSGRGFHILLRGKLPFKGANNRTGAEIYAEGRYFIMTGKTFKYTALNENQEALDTILDKYFQDVILVSDTKKGKGNNLVQDKSFFIGDGDFNITPTYSTMCEGGRHNGLLSIAGRLKRLNWSFDEIYDELQVANAQACVPPLSDKEVCYIAKSIMRYNNG